MTPTLSQFIEVAKEATADKKVVFLGKFTWPDLSEKVRITFENDPNTKIFLQPGVDEFNRISAWVVKE